MRKTHLLYIVCFLLSSLLLPKGIAQDFATQWHLPEGAKARLGRGTLINIKLSPDSTRIVASTSIGIWIYDAQTGEVVSLFTETQIGGERDGFMSKTPPEALTFSLDASIIATAHGNSIYVWDTFTGNAFAMLDEHPDAINATALSPDGTKLATAGGDWTVRLWEVSTGKYINSLTGHPSAVNAVAFSPDGKILASAGSTLRLWDADTGELLHADSKDLGSISLLAFSPDGKTLATGGGWDHTVHLWDWDVETGNPISTFDAVETVTALAFSPDGKTLASGSEKGLIQVWKPDQDYQIQTTLRGHQGAVHVLMFSPDGNTLASGSDDGTILLWDWERLK